MYQRALQGYEKALGLENVARYRPALTAIRNLGNLFAAQGHLDKAKEMYSRAFTGFQARLVTNAKVLNVHGCIASLDASATQGK
jgi:tetratricopeptide (TPR) repeat protein